MHACGHRLRLQSFKGPKEGSHDQGWEREWEETLPSRLPLRFFLFCFPSASSCDCIIQNINRKGQSTSYTYSLLICNNKTFLTCVFSKKENGIRESDENSGCKIFVEKGRENVASNNVEQSLISILD